jgi:hypothetical protein
LVGQRAVDDRARVPQVVLEVEAALDLGGRESRRDVGVCIGNSNAILPMITVAGVPPFHSDAIEAERSR